MRQVRVVWYDASSEPEWIDVLNISHDGPIKCITTGWVVRERVTHIKIAQSVASNGKVHHVLTIPKSCIHSFRDMGDENAIEREHEHIEVEEK